MSCSTEALLVIDMLQDFATEDGALYVGPTVADILPCVERELSAARASGALVVHVRDQHHPDDTEFRIFPEHCVRGTFGGEIVAALSPVEGEKVVDKRRYSAFFGTDLDLALREKGIRRLRMVGVCTNICILYTAADARMLNYDVVVPRSCVTSFDQGAHEFALAEMEKTLGVEVV